MVFHPPPLLRDSFLPASLPRIRAKNSSKPSSAPFASVPFQEIAPNCSNSPRAPFPTATRSKKASATMSLILPSKNWSNGMPVVLPPATKTSCGFSTLPLRNQKSRPTLPGSKISSPTSKRISFPTITSRHRSSTASHSIGCSSIPPLDSPGFKTYPEDKPNNKLSPRLRPPLGHGDRT